MDFYSFSLAKTGIVCYMYDVIMKKYKKYIKVCYGYLQGKMDPVSD